MQFITLDEGKQYLRVDSNDENALIENLLTTAEVLCCEVARLTEEQWASMCAEAQETGKAAEGDMERTRALMRMSILYTLGYLYEHREEADHHDLALTLRNLLFPIREGVL